MLPDTSPGLQHNLQRGLKKVKNEYKYKINVTLFLFYKNIS